MASMHVKAHILRDIHTTEEQRQQLFLMSFDEHQKSNHFAVDLISFCCLEYNSFDKLLYCGLTAMDNDIFYTFNPQSHTFRSLNFKAVSERFDVKVHRSLQFDDDGGVYGATACLHGHDQVMEGPGGKLFRYDPKTDRIEILCIPVPHQYIQTLSLDKKRRILYGFTYPYGYFFRFDIDTRQSRILGLADGEHIPVIDDNGNVWGQWHWLQMHASGQGVLPSLSFFKYNPDEDWVTWYKNVDLPGIYPGDDRCIDGSVNGRDGHLYFGSTAGALVRFDPKNLGSKYLGHPCTSGRMPGLCLGMDGLIYACAGDGGDTHLIAYNRQEDRLIDFGLIYDAELNTSCRRTHHICEGEPGTFYVAETDNLYRSGYLWECVVKRG